MPLTEAQQQVIAEKRRLALQKLQNAKNNQNIPKPVSAHSYFPTSTPAQQPTIQKPTSTSNPGKPAAAIFGRGNAIPSSWKGSPSVQNSFYGSAASQNSGKTNGIAYNSFGGVKRKFENTPWDNSAGSKNYKQSSGTNGWKKLGYKDGKLEVNLVLVSATHFEIRSKFDSDLVALIKTLPHREYDTLSKYWKFPFSIYDNVLSKLQSSPNLQMTLTTPPKFMYKLAENYSNFIKRLETFKLDWSKLPNSDQLMPFQKEGISWAICRNGRAIIADDMGLGKTVQALMSAYYFKNEWPLLVVCPSSLRNTWADAVVQWLPDVDPGAISVIYTASDAHYDYKPEVVIVSYSMAPKVKAELLKTSFKVVILDESHFVKTGKALRTQVVQELVRSTPRLLLLSGTPMLSKPIEMFTQLQLLDRASFTSQMIYGTRYCNARQQPWGMDYNGSSNLEEFKVLLTYCGFLRRMKSEVLSQLPPKTRKIISLDKNAVKTKDKGFACLSKKVCSLEASKLMSAQNKQILFEYYNASALAKLPAVINYITEIFESGVEKFLLFAHHVEMLDGVSDYLNKNDIDFIRIDGKTLATDRQPLVDKFQTSSQCKVALLSISAANTGLTLTAASLVIFAELYWNPGDLIQAEDRAYRIGQQCNVVVHYLIAEKTADDQLWPMVKNKLAVMKQAGLTHGDEFKDAEYGMQQAKAPVGQSTLSFFESSSNSKRSLESRDEERASSKTIATIESKSEASGIKEEDASAVTADLTLTQWDAAGKFDDDLGDLADDLNDDWGNDCDDLDLIQAADDIFGSHIQTCRISESNCDSNCLSTSKLVSSEPASSKVKGVSNQTSNEVTGTSSFVRTIPGSSNSYELSADLDLTHLEKENALNDDSIVYLSDGDSNGDSLASAKISSPQIGKKPEEN